MTLYKDVEYFDVLVCKNIFFLFVIPPHLRYINDMAFCSDDLKHARAVRRRNWAAVHIFLFLALAACGVWITLRGAEGLGYNWQWYRVPEFLGTWQDGSFTAGPLLKGLVVTFKITGVSLIMAFAIGLSTALLRLSQSYVGRMLARGYMELIRNTPLLTQIFFIYFVLAPLIGLGRFWAAVLALSLFEGAYASEVFRAGIVSIPKGQWEAAFSLGLSTWQTYRKVILPQAVRRILPPLTGLAVALVKDSALVSTIAIADLTWRGQVIISETFLTFEIWFTVAAMYLCITVTLSALVSFLERRMGTGN